MLHISSQEWPPQADEISLQADELNGVLQSEEATEKLKNLGSLCGHLFYGKGILPLHRDAILSVLEGQIGRTVESATDIVLSEKDARDTFASAYIDAQSNC